MDTLPTTVAEGQASAGRRGAGIVGDAENGNTAVLACREIQGPRAGYQWGCSVPGDRGVGTLPIGSKQWKRSGCARRKWGLTERSWGEAQQRRLVHV